MKREIRGTLEQNQRLITKATQRIKVYKRLVYIFLHLYFSLELLLYNLFRQKRDENQEKFSKKFGIRRVAILNLMFAELCSRVPATTPTRLTT